MKYKHLNKETVFENEHLEVFQEELELPEGQKVKWSFLKGSSAVGIVAIDDDDRVIFVKQYRPAIQEEIIEIPAGLVEENEDPMEAARRELEEETGYRANRLEKIFEYYNSPGFSNSKMYIYLAKGLEKTQQKLDIDEYLDVVKIDFSSIDESKLSDGKTLLAYNYIKATR